MTIGTTYLSDKFYVGLAAQNILSSSLDIGINKQNNQLEKHFYIHSGVDIDLNESYKIQPSVMINKIGALPIQLDMNVRADYNNILWTGLSYRVNDAIVTLFGLNFGPSSLAYSYDITTSSLATPSSGTHSVLFSYKFKKNEKDRDKDGYLLRERKGGKTGRRSDCDEHCFCRIVLPAVQKPAWAEYRKHTSISTCETHLILPFDY